MFRNFSLKKAKKKTQLQPQSSEKPVWKKELQKKDSESGKKSREKLEDENDDEGSRSVPPWLKDVLPEQKAAYECFARQIFAQGVDGLLKEYAEEIKGYHGQPAARIFFDQNMARNRYKDVVCNDLTRVIIADGKQPDYIHANYIRGEPLFNEFICTQGPMATTKDDFWRMIWHLKVQHVIMLCETVEWGKIKCEQYWPLGKGEKMTFGDITVEHSSQNTKDSQVVVTCLTLTHSEAGEKTHTLRHHHWKTWPDRSVPKSCKAVLRILRCVRFSAHPIVVHCSAGIGRTGTLVAVEMCLQSILQSNQLSLITVCKRLRDQRHSVLQADTQFVYVALVVLEFGRLFNYFDSPDLLDGFAKFKAHLEAVVTARDSERTMLVEKTNIPSGRPEKKPSLEQSPSPPEPVPVKKTETVKPVNKPLAAGQLPAKPVQAKPQLNKSTPFPIAVQSKKKPKEQLR